MVKPSTSPNYLDWTDFRSLLIGWISIRRLINYFFLTLLQIIFLSFLTSAVRDGVRVLFVSRRCGWKSCILLTWLRSGGRSLGWKVGRGSGWGEIEDPER